MLGEQLLKVADDISFTACALPPLKDVMLYGVAIPQSESKQVVCFMQEVHKEKKKLTFNF